MAPLRRLALGLILTGCAGFIDAIGFIELSGYYTSFMSGNTTQLGIGAASATGLLLPLSLVLMFFVGSFVGSILALRDRQGPQLVLGFVIACVLVSIGLSLGGYAPAQAMLSLAAGAGAQNAVVPYGGGARLGTTFVSGTLFSAGQDLAGAIAGRAPRWRWTQHLAVWGALLAGALVGALGHRWVGLFAVLAPGAVYLGLLLLFAARGSSQAN